MGDTILARGEPRRNKWTNKDGQEQVSWEIAADYAELMDAPSSTSSGRENGFPSATAADEMDDLPF